MNILKNSIVNTPDGKPFYNVQMIGAADGFFEIRTLYWHPNRQCWITTPGDLIHALTPEAAERDFIDRLIVCEDQAERVIDEEIPLRTQHYLGEEYEHRDMVAG